MLFIHKLVIHEFSRRTITPAAQGDGQAFRHPARAAARASGPWAHLARVVAPVLRLDDGLGRADPNGPVRVISVRQADPPARQ